MIILDTRLDLIFPVWLKTATLASVEQLVGTPFRLPPNKTLRIVVSIVDIPPENEDSAGCSKLEQIRLDIRRGGPRD